jgi:hypothetical protein
MKEAVPTPETAGIGRVKDLFRDFIQEHPSVTRIKKPGRDCTPRPGSDSSFAKEATIQRAVLQAYP